MPQLDKATALVVHKSDLTGGFTLVDEDLYLIRLTKVAVASRPDKNGNMRWNWSWEIERGQVTGDKFKGKSQRCSTGFTEDQAWYPHSIFEAFGVKSNVNTDTLLGKTVCSLITQREIESGPRKGQITNDLSQFSPASAIDGDSGDDGGMDEFSDDASGAGNDDPDF